METARLQREVGLDRLGAEFLHKGIGGALRLGFQAHAGEIEFDAKRRAPRARHRALKLAGSIARSNRAIEAQQSEQRGTLLRRQLGLDGNVAMQELVEI